jgi:hypothetical protein
MDRKDLLVLRESPSFGGELSVRLIEEHESEGPAKYFLICQKNPPLNENELSIFVWALSRVVGRDREEITKSINWQREVAPLEAKTITAIFGTPSCRSCAGKRSWSRRDHLHSHDRAWLQHGPIHLVL